jgi:hypothetical protein
LSEQGSADPKDKRKKNEGKGNDLAAIVGILILAAAGSTFGLQGILAGFIGGVGIYLIVRSAVATERL